jgi:hypothetical protein
VSVSKDDDYKAGAVEELLDALEDVVNQACWSNDDGLLDSMALSAYAHGLRTLAEYGRVTIEHSVGRRVIAHWVPEHPESTL